MSLLKCSGAVCSDCSDMHDAAFRDRIATVEAQLSESKRREAELDRLRLSAIERWEYWDYHANEVMQERDQLAARIKTLEDGVTDVIKQRDQEMKRCDEVGNDLGHQLSETKRRELQVVSERASKRESGLKHAVSDVMETNKELSALLAESKRREAQLQERVQTFEWAIGCKDKQISEFSDEVNSRGARIKTLEDALKLIVKESPRAFGHWAKIAELALAAKEPK